MEQQPISEIKFQGSDLQKHVDDICRRKNKESLSKFLNQSKIALKEQPSSEFWKDAVAFMEDKHRRLFGDG